MKLELTIPTLAILNTITSGVEEGIQYWAKVVSFRTPPRPSSTVELELELECDLIEIDTSARISLREQWAAGLRFE